MIKLNNLARQTTAPSFTRSTVTFTPDLWDALSEYRQRREQSGFMRLGARAVLGLTGDDARLESAADHLAVSCQSDDDLLMLARRCDDLGAALRSRLK